MKKTIILIFALCLTGITNAQEIADHAIGLRLGDSDGMGAEVSYQHKLGETNRLEADLGWRSSKHVDAFKLTGLYQWVWNIDGNFNWYAGAGGGLGSWSYNQTIAGEKFKDNGTFFFAAGDVGIEYNFDFPLLLSLDIRPELGFTKEYRDDLDLDIAIGARYQF
ncbi:MAG: hypothetical protein ACPG45_09790 [Flavobacteriaceae bacterium]